MFPSHITLKEKHMPQWASGTLTANGVQIHYHRTGGDKPPIVLSHGITDNGLCWTRVGGDLQQDYDLIMYDARGHGLSGVPAEGYTADGRAADLVGLIQALALDRPCLLGHSMGAATSAKAAASCPGLVRAAILEDPPWRRARVASDLDRATRLRQWRSYISELQSMTREQIIAYGHEHRSTWAEEELDPWADAKLQVSANVFQAITTQRMPWQDTVRQITCPTLLITADPERGAIVTPGIAEEAAEICPSLRVVHIEGAGHNVRREQYESYIRVVRGFLDEVMHV
jgi:pimeloyl-ACP methyl ester carboxylesterase